MNRALLEKLYVLRYNLTNQLEDLSNQRAMPLEASTVGVVSARREVAETHKREQLSMVENLIDIFWLELATTTPL